MREIKVKFTDYFEGFDAEHCKIAEILKQHYKVVFSDEPEYLFYTVFSDEHLKYDCVKIFVSGENLAPDFNLCDYALSSEKLTFGDRHLYYPYFVAYADDIAKLQQKHLNVTDGAAKRDFCSFVYSNDRADAVRGQLFTALSAYRKVDSGGRFQNNVGGPVADKVAFESQHKFSIACENSSHPGYLTEKLVQAFAAGTVPVYWGDPDVETIFNPKAFVNANRFRSAEEVAAEVKRLNEDDEAYLAMLREPAFLDSAYVDKLWQSYEDFILHIVEQPYEKAFRRNRVFWGKLYREKLLRWQESDSRSFGNGIKRILRKFKREIR